MAELGYSKGDAERDLMSAFWKRLDPQDTGNIKVLTLKKGLLALEGICFDTLYPNDQEEEE